MTQPSEDIVPVFSATYKNIPRTMIQELIRLKGWSWGGYCHPADERDELARKVVDLEQNLPVQISAKVNRWILDNYHTLSTISDLVDGLTDLIMSETPSASKTSSTTSRPPSSTGTLELLMAAARAAGISVVRSRLDDPMNRDLLINNSPRNRLSIMGSWNPLDDDGDAMRLATKLRIAFEIVEVGGQEFVSVQWLDLSAIKLTLMDEITGDEAAAVRRAIVTMAAMIDSHNTQV